MNDLIDALAAGQGRLGLWQALASPYAAEVCAAAGFDWLLLDGEHAPNTLTTLLGQLQAVAQYDVEVVARPPISDATWIKQYLDLGVTTLLLPMVETAEQAEALVAATRFPPRGIRGVASSTSRASRFGSRAGYLQAADAEIGVIVQIESRQGVDNVEDIAGVDGVDGVFIGPGDLAASLGHLGEPGHPEVRAVIEAMLPLIHGRGAFSGIFALNADDAREWLAQGVGLVSLGTDIGLLVGGGRALLASV